MYTDSVVNFESQGRGMAPEAQQDNTCRNRNEIANVPKLSFLNHCVDIPLAIKVDM